MAKWLPFIYNKWRACLFLFQIYIKFFFFAFLFVQCMSVIGHFSCFDLIWLGVLFFGFHNDCGSDFYFFIYVKNSFFLCEMDEIYLNGLVMCKLHLGRRTHVTLMSYLPLLCYNFSKIAPGSCRTRTSVSWFQVEETKEGLRKT